MTKEIREGIRAVLIQQLFLGIPSQVDAILGYLHSKGCVIKVDRELRKYSCHWHKDTIDLNCFTCGDMIGRTNEQGDLLKAGYVAVEELI